MIVIVFAHHEICVGVIALVAIYMVDYGFWRQRLPEGLFSLENMFIYVAITVGAWVTRCMSHRIPELDYDSAHFI